MAIIKRKQMKELNLEDLRKRLGEMKLEASKERAQIAIGGSPKNPGKVKEIRRTIAKLITELNKRKKEVVKTGRSM